MTNETTCTCTLGWRACVDAAERRCYVCGAALCSACARTVVTRDGTVTICGCGARMCAYALSVAAARAVA